jgi:lysophospholipase L1-like esterase
MPYSVWQRAVVRVAGVALLLAVASALAMLSGEALLRVWDPPISRPGLIQIHRTSEIFGWELVPGASGVGMLGESIEINAAGQRDVDHAPLPADGVARIVAIGDSFTFGMGVAPEDTWPKQLEARLGVRGIRTEVVNLGVIGYNAWQYVEVLRRRALALRPALVVVAFFVDDLTASLHPREIDPDWRPTNPFEQLLEGGMSRSHLLNFVRNARRMLAVRTRALRGARHLQGIQQRRRAMDENPQAAFPHILRGTLREIRYAQFHEALRRLAASTREAHVPMLAVFLPDATQLHDPERQHVNGFVAEAAREAGIPFVDATPGFEARSDAESLFLFPVDAHPNSEGQGLIAEIVAQAVSDDALLAEAGSSRFENRGDSGMLVEDRGGPHDRPDRRSDSRLRSPGARRSLRRTHRGVGASSAPPAPVGALARLHRAGGGRTPPALRSDR